MSEFQKQKKALQKKNRLYIFSVIVWTLGFIAALFAYSLILVPIIMLLVCYTAPKFPSFPADEEIYYTEEKLSIKGKYIFLYIVMIVIFFFISLYTFSINRTVGVFLMSIPFFLLVVLVVTEVIFNKINQEFIYNPEYHIKTKKCFICNFEIFNESARYCNQCGWKIPPLNRYIPTPRIVKKEDVTLNYLDYCPYCNFEIERYRGSHCEKCGAKIFNMCTNCQFIILDKDATYCEQCGTKITLIE